LVKSSTSITLPEEKIQIMKLIINNDQFKLLTNNFRILEGQGLCQNRDNLINESMKEFKVKVFFGGWPAEIRVGANSSASALSIVRLMFPKATITSFVTSL
jgi:hypothetical protein